MGTSPKMSSTPVTCKNCCANNLYWSWNFQTKKPVLVETGCSPHRCPTPNTQDIFPGWCEKCKATELVWLRKKNGMELYENYGLPHACEQDKVIQDVSEAKCRHCTTPNLFWVKVNFKFSLVQLDGTKHTCPNYSVFMKDWAEAKRMNYALEKAWLKSIPDYTMCTKCKGYGYIAFLSKSKRRMRACNSTEPIRVSRFCQKCKCMGVFTALKKAVYLKHLRMKYWPFRSGIHIWKKGTLLGL